MKVSAIIPVFNEEKNIEYVLLSLKKSFYIDEIICINDGSTDKSLQVIKKFKNIIPINLRNNHGKAYAITRGITKAKGQIILLIDGDLKGLTDHHFKQFIRPLETKEYRVTIGYLHDRVDKFMRLLSGMRAYFKSDLLPYTNEIKKRGYGLELYLNYVMSDKKTKYFSMRGVRHSIKYQKQSLKISTKLILVEVIEILKEMSRQKKPIGYFLKVIRYLKKYLSKSIN